ncbi:recombinase family protein [Halorubrum distributum]|uniref:Resolvase domain-containing protein n=1 Tax=Halorubrum distributum JCM 13916 TaxID=1230455 RepID=M0PK60_9EURY|nr:recombinase family protein [Halorubrum arcis]EMA70333.1 resolvase domain-containing protein [Halorubrum arcis JCM 13916]
MMIEDHAVPRTMSPSGGSTNEDDPIEYAAIYARTSSSSQRFGYSIGEQVDRCSKQCEQMGWNVTFVFTDEAESGRNTDRPKFQEMLDRARGGCFDVVVFWKLDRFCRSLVDLVKTEEQLSEWDVSLQSVTEYIDTTSPVGRFNFRNLASAAELESDLTSQRVRMGMHGLAKEHKWPNDKPPLGYEKTSDGKLRVLADEASVVKTIFRLYPQEKSMPRVASLLNESGLRTKAGELWCRQSVRKVLTNEIYTGSYQVADYHAQVEEYRILDDTLFKTVVETRFRYQHQKGRMQRARKQRKAERILSDYREWRDI